MSDIQLYLAIGLPTVTVLTALVLNTLQIHRLREEMRSQFGALREDMRSQMASFREDIRELRSDIKLLTGLRNAILKDS